MDIFLGFLGLICLGYYLVCVRYAGTRVSLLWIWMAGGMACWGTALGLRFGLWETLLLYFPRGVRLMFGGAAALAFAVLAVLVALVLSAMGDRGRKDLDVLVVLGCQVKGRVPSRALAGRLETARKYLEKHEGTVAVLSGGKGYGEEITEAECMREWLVERKIASGRLLLEEHSTSTAENLLFSRKILMERDKRNTWSVGIVTNHFHMYRSLRIAGKAGFDNVCGIGAPGGNVLTPHYVLREAVAVLKEIVCRNI